MAWSFGKKLKELRERQGLSANALALKAGVTRQAISYFETGRYHRPLWPLVQRLVMALGVAYEELADPGIVLPTQEELEAGRRSVGRPKLQEAEPEPEPKPARPKAKKKPERPARKPRK